MPVTLIDQCDRFRSDQLSRLHAAGAFLLSQNNLSDHNVNIVLTNDEEISRFNKKYRKHAGPTNVLSFPFEPELDQITPLTSPAAELGDIIISVETAEKEAFNYDQSLYHRLSWLMTHGILHLLGFDHERSEADANEMYDLEEHLMSELHNRRRRNMTQLAINVDSVAAIRQAKGVTGPDPVTTASICELAGARGIAVHLREDRRAIQDRDVKLLREIVQTKLILEIAAVKEMIKFALDLRPDIVSLVPERKHELSVETGLDVISQKKKLARIIEKMTKADIPVSLFIDPDLKQVKAAFEAGATYVGLNTGSYSKAPDLVSQQAELALIEAAAEEAWQLGLHVNAGHRLNYVNTSPIAAVETIEELHIGHAIVSLAIFSGIEQAVREMDRIIRSASSIL